MKNIVTSFLSLTKNTFWVNVTNRWLLILTILFSGLDYYLWQNFIHNLDQFFNIRIGIYPLQYMSIILLINTLLALASYERDREVTYFLLMSNIIIVYLITILEFCYILR